ncbi:exported hypothetical protein [Candidatus Sulfopaludibacter sp. SbA6]|nr:exported hypothetical protein [Candidatus Sulfopaludibacter sp. SbA6]
MPSLWEPRLRIELLHLGQRAFSGVYAGSASASTAPQPESSIANASTALPLDALGRRGGLTASGQLLDCKQSHE